MNIGRYNKFSRTLSQTAWLLPDEESSLKDETFTRRARPKTSIEEIMGNILKRELSAKGFFSKFCKVTFFLFLIHFFLDAVRLDCVFTASGREDIDVKCLGDGRPFMLEFFEPKRTRFTREELDYYQKVNLPFKNFYIFKYMNI